MPPPSRIHEVAGPPAPRSGFSLIEVLVATVVMAIMVVMLGGFFQQASSSWDSGYARAEGGMAVRSVVGALTRDLATAVDGRILGETWKDPINVSGSKVEMYRLKAGAEDGQDIEYVKYEAGNGTVERNGKSLILNPGKMGGSSFETKFSFAKGTVPAALQDAEFRPYEGAAFRGDSNRRGIAWTVPYVKVRCELYRKGTFSGLKVRSVGSGEVIEVH